MNSEFVFYVDSEAAMVAFGEALGSVLSTVIRQAVAVVFLDGDLGAGKTTLCRGVLQACGHKGAVKSPTYTLVEPYQFAAVTVYHFDLYRLGDPEELEYIGIRDYFEPGNICLIEWPDKGQGILHKSDLDIAISVVAPGRQVCLRSHSTMGESLIARMRSSLPNSIIGLTTSEDAQC